MISVLPSRETLAAENPPSLSFSDKEFLKPSGSKNLLPIGKIWEENKLTCSKNTTLNLKDGDSPSKFMPSSQGSKSFKKPWKDTQTSSKSQKEVFWLTNTSSLNWWRTMATWMKVNMRFSNPFTRASSQWPQRRKLRLFTWDALLKSVTREQRFVKELKKMKFPCNTCKRSISSTKTGSRTTMLRKFWSSIQHRISKTMNSRSRTWLCNSGTSSIID